MNIIRFELSQYRKSILGWGIAYVAIVTLFMQFSPMFIEEAENLRTFFDSLGGAFAAALGLDVNTFFSALGFYSYIFMYISLVGAMQAMSLGLGILGKERNMRTADFLLTRPVSRSRIFLCKLAAALGVLLISQALLMAAAYGNMALFVGEGYDGSAFLLMNLTFVLLQCLFLCIGMAVAALANRIRSETMVSAGVVFGLFVLGMISSIAGADTLRWLIPFKYFDNNYIMQHGSYEWAYFFLGLGLMLLSLAASYTAYRRRDIPAL